MNVRLLLKFAVLWFMTTELIKIFSLGNREKLACVEHDESSTRATVDQISAYYSSYYSTVVIIRLRVLPELAIWWRHQHPTSTHAR